MASLWHIELRMSSVAWCHTDGMQTGEQFTTRVVWVDRVFASRGVIEFHFIPWHHQYLSSQVMSQILLDCHGSSFLCQFLGLPWFYSHFSVTNHDFHPVVPSYYYNFIYFLICSMINGMWSWLCHFASPIREVGRKTRSSIFCWSLPHDVISWGNF